MVLRFNVLNVAGTNCWQGANQGFLSLGVPRTYLFSTGFTF